MQIYDFISTFILFLVKKIKEKEKKAKLFAQFKEKYYLCIRLTKVRGIAQLV